MIVLNLGIDAHKVVDDIETGGSSGTYGASRRMMSKGQSAEGPAKTELTEEQRRYADMYDNEHDKYFKTGSSPVHQDAANQDANTATDKNNEVLPNEDMHQEESVAKKFFSSIRNIFKKKREEKK